MHVDLDFISPSTFVADFLALCTTEFSISTLCDDTKATLIVLTLHDGVAKNFVLSAPVTVGVDFMLFSISFDVIDGR